MTDTSGPAFPRADSISPDGTFWEAGNNGMTLRDWFAGQAMSAICKDRSVKGFSTTGQEAAEWMAVQAYGYADAMLAERKK